MQKALAYMRASEVGELARLDEGRMDGQHWLRNPGRPANPERRQEIEEAVKATEECAAEIHDGGLGGEQGEFKNLMVFEIGGSALRPRFFANELVHPRRRFRPFFFDYPNSDGMKHVLAAIDPEGSQIHLVIPNSGETKETRNGVIESGTDYNAAAYDLEKHAVAVTRKGVNWTIAHRETPRFEGFLFGAGSVKEPVSDRFLACYVLSCNNLRLEACLLVQRPSMNQQGSGPPRQNPDRFIGNRALSGWHSPGREGERGHSEQRPIGFGHSISSINDYGVR